MDGTGAHPAELSTAQGTWQCKAKAGLPRQAGRCAKHHLPVDPTQCGSSAVSCQSDLSVIKREGFWGQGETVLQDLPAGEGRSSPPLGRLEYILDRNYPAAAKIDPDGKN